MEQKRYKVIFSGESVPAHEVERVKNNLATLFRVEPSKLDGLFTNRLTVIKKDLDLSDADHYRETIEQIGGYCIIELMGLHPEKSVMNLSARAEKMVCPKCRTVQAAKPVCRSCGILVQDFRQRLTVASHAVLESMQPQKGLAPPLGIPAVQAPDSLSRDSERSS